MQMSTKYGFAFLCMPKCASSSIEAATRKYCNINFSGFPALKHINAQLFSDKILAAHQSLCPSANIESFCLMRDPLQWIESWYRFRARNELKKQSHPNHINYTGNISYNDFIKSYLSKGRKEPYARLGTQYNFLKLSNGEIGIDHIIPMNRMDLVSEFLSKKIGVLVKIPQKNVSPVLSINLDKDLEAKLRQRLSYDIKIYNFVNFHGKFSKSLHGEELSDLLRDDH